MIEVGRRLGVALEGVGMPGHFLVGAGSGVYVDPFHGGLSLDVDGCRVLFEQLRPDVPFDARHLEPVDAHAIIARMLANLVNTLVARAPTGAAWAVRLRCAVPGVSAAERRDGAPCSDHSASSRRPPTRSRRSRLRSTTRRRLARRAMRRRCERDRTDGFRPMVVS